MIKTIDAIYEKGAFHPLEPVEFEEHQRVILFVDDSGTRLSDEATNNRQTASMPKNGAELIAYWEQHGVIGSRPDITDSVKHAQMLRRQAENRQP